MTDGGELFVCTCIIVIWFSGPIRRIADALERLIALAERGRK